jgi:phospholipid/cholesterol/gamma-HCH transport system substrate-binding protein
MKRAGIETAVGIFVAIGLICVGYLTIKLGKMELLGDNHYNLYARFQSVSGLKEGAFIEMAGVRIGKVDSITLDKETQTAMVKMKLQKT